MFSYGEIVREIKRYISEEFNIQPLSIESDLQLSSIQILNTVTWIEKTYQIEVDDKYIFHGMFKNIRLLSLYISGELGSEQNRNMFLNAVS
ncbi:hypothetical protein [Acetivibrio mesophilus]|uniref:Carrier domain-containing protein n=1 Tax=Acetivibrio mesophilus TaxID=2487273 RepID=A0A4Q0I8C4_9FIRM|nr:hypothetical protein [Acetivibrio mesophilus]ODM26241.1 hypothetical protein A7W90_08390 [Clostridium sp. Bc-iso-3]RXE60706.1 hypothetical protein EFD62_01950 [Acetivibrio mesophilus]HHV28119.1 hypothetical protein [Clostridium sp.]